VTTVLGTFPLIRSYVTETVPPNTLRIHIVEREPVGAVQANGVFSLVDPAGIVVLESAERVPGVPVIDLQGETTASPVFESIVEVLLAMPRGLLEQVDSISATTKDDVSLVLTGVGQRVSWGSAENSARKAAVLEALIEITDSNREGEFDVSAPGNGIFSPG
jgi:cell division protein FtsQ